MWLDVVQGVLGGIPGSFKGGPDLFTSWLVATFKHLWDLHLLCR